MLLENIWEITVSDLQKLNSVFKKYIFIIDNFS